MLHSESLSKAGVSTNPMDRPREDKVMEEVTVETFGVDYPEPEKM